MTLINLIQNILSPYSNMIKTDFRPLEYIEVKQDKPLIVKLNERWIFKCSLQNINNFIKFNTSKNLILNQLNKLNEMNSNDLSVSSAKVISFKLIIRLLYEISKQEYKGFFKKRKYFKFLNKYFFDNLDILTDL